MRKLSASESLGVINTDFLNVLTIPEFVTLEFIGRDWGGGKGVDT